MEAFQVVGRPSEKIMGVNMATEVTTYDVMPSGQYGVAVEMIEHKGKPKRIAHTHLMAQDVANDNVSVSMPTNMSLAELRDYAGKLLAFADQVENLKNTAPKKPI